MPGIDAANIDEPVDEKLLMGEGGDGTTAGGEDTIEAGEDTTNAGSGEDTSGDDTIDAADGKDDKRDSVIPRARFDEVNNKLKAEREAREAAEARAAAAEARSKAGDAGDAGGEQPQAVDLDALEAQYMTHLMNGEEDEAKAVRKTIREQERRLAVAEAERNITEREQARLTKSAVDESVKAYPFLDSNNPDHDAEAIAMVVGLRDRYVSQGMPFHEAITKAAKRVGDAYAKDQGEAKDDKVVAIDDPRKQRALERAADAARRQPPIPISGAGNRTVPTVPAPKSQKDWEKLPEDERAKLLA